MNDYGVLGRPHALSRSTSAEGERTFQYDENGRQTEVKLSSDGRSQLERTITYTPFDLPARVIMRGGSEDVSFQYDAYGRRIVKANSSGSIVSIDGLYEARRRLGENGVSLEQVAYIPGEDGALAQLSFDQNGDLDESRVRYFQTDALGSVSFLTDADANASTVFDYEPFGQRTPPAGSGGSPSAEEPRVRKGFTGHVHDEDLGLIDMNGRVYDPAQRRFVTPDPFVVHAEGEYALRAAVTASDPLSWLGGGFEPLKPNAFVRDLPVSQLLGRVLAPTDRQGSPGGVSAGSSDRSGYQPTSVVKASSPSRIGSPSGGPGSAPSGAAAGPNLSPSGNVANGGAPAHGSSVSLEAHNPYSYAYNSPLNYVDPTGYCPVCIVAAAGILVGFGTTLASDDAAKQREAHPEAAEDPVQGVLLNLEMLGAARAAGGLFAASRTLAHSAGEQAAPKALRMGPGAAGADEFVKKVVNTDMGHAAERAVERAGFASPREAREALQAFGRRIEQEGVVPDAAIRDSANPDRWIVPGFGQGGTVVYQVRDGVLKLKTVLNWRGP